MIFEPKKFYDTGGSWDELSLFSYAAYLISRAQFLQAEGDDRDLFLLGRDWEEIDDAVLSKQLVMLGFQPIDNRQTSAHEYMSFLDGPHDLRPVDLLTSPEPEGYYRHLFEAIKAAEEWPSAQHIGAALKLGLAAPDSIVALAALSSCLKLYSPDSFPPRLWLGVFTARWAQLEPLSQDLLTVLSSALISDPPGSKVPPAPAQQKADAPGLLLVHGTHFEVDPDPTWYYPHVGDLHNYIKPHRNDIFSGQNYYEWEGRWSDRGRHIAAKHLKNWIDLEAYHGCDVVAHSHGCNVVMKTADMGAHFNKVVFLSCPVHWHKYNLNSGRINAPYSVRVWFDLVILADGGRQKFPASANVADEVVGGWFSGHSATRTSRIWGNHTLEAKLI
ncbi:hypothetical protein [Ruegeria denitrificans]|uniref:hypothetical protein n=1 Tax=Ruegeria denitrificans TaxID=1715692 RepID=UPI003C7A091E